MSTPKRIAEKIRYREGLNHDEILYQAGIYGIATISQGRDRDKQEIALDLSRATGMPVIVDWSVKAGTDPVVPDPTEAAIETTPASIGTEIFVAANGSDSNAGTASAPLLTAAAAIAKMTQIGARVYFRRGDTFPIPSQVTPPTSGSVMSPMYIGAYGDPNKAKPIWDALENVTGVSGDWTEVNSSDVPASGTNIWRRTLSQSSNLSCFFNLKPGNTHSTTISGVNVANDWRHNGTSFYVFSTSNPGSAGVSIHVARVDRVFGCNSKSNFTIENIVFRGGYNIGAVDTGDGANINYIDCETYANARSGFLVRSNGARMIRCKAYDLGFSTGLGEHGFAVAGPAWGVIMQDCVAYNCLEDGLQLRNTTPLLDTFEPVRWYGGVIHSCGENAVDCKRGTLHIRGAYMECVNQHTITLQGEFNTLVVEDSILHHRGSSLCIFAQEGSYVGSSNPTLRGTRVISRRNLYATLGSECVEINSAGICDDCIFEADMFNGTATGTPGVVTFRSGINHIMRQCYIRNRSGGQAFRRRATLDAVHFASFESNIISCNGNVQAFYDDGVSSPMTVTVAAKNVFRKTTNTSGLIRYSSTDYSGTQLTDGTLTAAFANFGGSGSIATTTDLSPSIACTITRSGQTCTVSLVGHQLVQGQKAAIFNAVETAYNRPFFVKTVVDADTFTFDLPEGIALPSSPATGSPVMIDMRIISAPPTGVDTGGDQIVVALDNTYTAFPNPSRPFGALAAKRT